MSGPADTIWEALRPAAEEWLREAGRARAAGPTSPPPPPPPSASRTTTGDRRKVDPREKVPGTLWRCPRCRSLYRSVHPPTCACGTRMQLEEHRP